MLRDLSELKAGPSEQPEEWFEDGVTKSLRSESVHESCFWHGLDSAKHAHIAKRAPNGPPNEDPPKNRLRVSVCSFLPFTP